MNDDQVKGTGKKITGSLKEAIGKVTGDKKTQAEGNRREGCWACRGCFGESPKIKSGSLKRLRARSLAESGVHRSLRSVVPWAHPSTKPKLDYESLALEALG